MPAAHPTSPTCGQRRGAAGGVLPWDAAYATFRAAESQQFKGRANRDEAAALLRRAHALVQAARRTHRARGPGTYSAARTRLDEGTPATAPPAELGSDGRPWGDHPREREILEQIVAGRTYGEIARALILIEKTVSSHVSNLLRKSGAAQPHRARPPRPARGDRQP